MGSDRNWNVDWNALVSFLSPSFFSGLTYPCQMTGTSFYCLLEHCFFTLLLLSQVVKWQEWHSNNFMMIMAKMELPVSDQHAIKVQRILVQKRLIKCILNLPFQNVSLATFARQSYGEAGVFLKTMRSASRFNIKRCTWLSCSYYTGFSQTLEWKEVLILLISNVLNQTMTWAEIDNHLFRNYPILLGRPCGNYNVSVESRLF